MIKNRTYTIENQLLNYELLSSYISLFWSDVFSPLVLKGADKHLMIMVKVSFDTPKFDYAYRSLGHLRCVNHNEQEQFTDYLSERLTYLNESYTSNSLNKIHFSYIVKEGLAKDDRRLLQPLVQDKGSTTHRFNNMNLPVSMIPSDFGTIIAITQHTTFTRYIATNGPRVYQIDVSLDNLTNKVSVLGSAQLSWTDTKLAFDVGFKREIGKSTLYFLDGELVVRKYQVPAKPFTQLKVDPNMVSNFVTMDLETITQDGKLTPYLVCAYNGKDYITSYANESLDQKVLFTSFIEQLLTFFGKSNNLMVYAHNLSGFDGIFLMKHLLSFGKVEPLLFNGRLMSIKIKLNNKLAGGKYYGKVIIFKDSYLLLPLSLRKLCKAFNVVTSKGFFPFLMNTINYIGELPQFKYWKGVSDLEYNGLLSDYTNKLWSFKDEAIKYCKLDCKCLYDVLTKFNILIFKEFKVNMTKSLTLPALAMRIFKTHFMPKDSIYQILGSVEQDIRNSYTGGAVDVYIPHNRLGSFFLPVAGLFKKLYYYDVNSLYPAVMAKHLMPIGKPIKFVGDIRKMEPEAFGFFYCKITSPDNLNHPILQRRIKTSEGIRTIAGLGSWTGWISSLELDNAVKYGYQFEILNGYQFERGDLFSGYVNKLYQLRLQYPKPHAMNLIAKLLMNSLYGKFGMKLETTVVDIFDCSTPEGSKLFENALEAYGETIHDYINLDGCFVIVRDSRVDIKYSEDQDMYHGLEVNIAIASAITAAARVQMSVFKNNPLFNLYYTDTDSIVIDKQLPESMVGDKLGQLKLEHVVNRAVETYKFIILFYKRSIYFNK